MKKRMRHIYISSLLVFCLISCTRGNGGNRITIKQNEVLDNTFLNLEDVEVIFPETDDKSHDFKRRKRSVEKNLNQHDIDKLFLGFGASEKRDKSEKRPTKRKTNIPAQNFTAQTDRKHRNNDHKKLRTLPTQFPEISGRQSTSISNVPNKQGVLANKNNLNAKQEFEVSPKKVLNPKKNDTRKAKSVLNSNRKRPVFQSLLTRSRDEHQISSGQEIRLSGGKMHNEGVVEVYHYGRWGLICDDNWQLVDGNVVCKQLGYYRGAQSAMGGSYYGTGSYRQNDILMDEVECKGTEHRVQECTHVPVHDCTLNEAASVSCMLNDGCEHGWVAGDGVCYRLSDDLAMFDVAKESCEEMGAHLVTVENQQESDFITNWLMTASNETYFWSAGRLVTEDGMPTWKWLDVVYPMKFTKWFPGWPPNAIHRQPSNHTGQECVTLARRFYDPWNLVRDVGYYFWNDAPCNVRIPYVCKKLGSSQTDCYENFGENYMGRVHRTDKGTLCVKWVLSPKINPQTHPDRGLGDHNFCRNPDDDVKPWCWVDIEKGRFGYCAVSQCGVSSSVSPLTTPQSQSNISMPLSTVYNVTPLAGSAIQTTSSALPDENILSTEYAPIEICSSSEFECNQTEDRLCIPLLWQCDGESDCPAGEDEENCKSNHMEDYKVEAGKKMVLSNRRDVQTMSYVYISAEKCAKHCSTTRNFVCRSFNHVYDANQKQECILFNVTSSFGGGRLVNSPGSTHYESIYQISNCSLLNQFQCSNGKCINQSLVCNGNDDCNDFSDETLLCSTATPPVTVRLAAGEGSNEGRVEIRYFGEWGVICDDGWDLKDANVVCRQLGYQGATRATKMSEFGHGTGNFLLDEVACTGRESSITQCKHNGWRNHDCGNYEVAGVVCKAKKLCDENSQFECAANSACIPITYICDGENDCGDNSDEQECKGIEINLVGGSTPYEGRVEIVRNGMHGTICDDDWDDNDAVVVCRMLGFGYGHAQAVTGGKFGPGGGAIWLDDVDCKGTELTLDQCSHAPWGNHNCLHTEDAGVICMNSFQTSTAPNKNQFFPTDSNMPSSSLPVPSPMQCGYRPIYQKEPRIAGGYIADYGAYPWQVAVWRWRLLSGWGHWCGGAILNDRWILTAAHPYVNRPKEHIRIVVGNLHNQEMDEHEQQFNVEAIISHKSYSRFTHDNDISLIKILPNSRGQYIRFSKHVQPVCLPSDELKELPVGQSCIISGWGSSSSGRVFSNHLRAAMVPIINDTICRMIYKYDLTKRMLCAGFLEGSVDSCQGDSGGSLVCDIDGQYTVLGVTSWGHGCAQPYAPGVYTKVQEFLSWISSTMARLS